MEKKIRNKPLLSGVALALTLALSACGSGDGSPTDSVNQTPENTVEPGAIIDNGDFETALGNEWFFELADGTPTIIDGEMVVVDLAPGGNPWEGRLVQNTDTVLTHGTSYKISFDAKADEARSINIQLGKLFDADPWFAPFMDDSAVALTTTMESYEVMVTVDNPDGLTADLIFALGAGAATPITLDNIAITEVVEVKAREPIFGQSSSDLTSVQTLEFSSKTNEAQIYYTTDGTDPTVDSLLYTQPILVTSSLTIKAVAIKNDLENSDVVSRSYTISDVFDASYDLSEGDIIQSSEAGDKQSSAGTLSFTENDTLPSGNIILIQPDAIKQTIDGFGGSLTESSAYILSYLTPEKRAEVMEAYFSEEKAGYTMSRTHLASTDFAVDGNYSYAPAGDPALADFSIEEDTKGFADTPVPDEAGYEGLYDGLSPTDPSYDLLPLIQEAVAIAPGLRIIASPWTAPDWMKTNNHWYDGWLKGEHYSTFADYFSKYLAAYKAEGVDIWAVTPENEPHGNGGQWESMVFSADAEATFIRENLGPTLAEDGFADVKILGYDQNRGGVGEFADALLGDPDTAQYVYGSAVHWYGSSYLTFDAELDAVHYAYPDKVIINSEATIDSLGDDEELYSWWKNDSWWWNENATEWGYHWAQNKDNHPIYTPVHRYARNIIEGMNHWLTGWVDWNIVLDKRGGPNHVSNFCGAPVMIDPIDGYVYYTPLYDVMSHFSKYIKPGDKVLNTATFTPSLDSDVLHATAVKNANGDITVAILNTSKNPVDFDILIGNQKTTVTIAANALQTIILN